MKPMNNIADEQQLRENNNQSISSASKDIAQQTPSEPPAANISSVSPEPVPAATANIVPPNTSVLYPNEMDLTQGIIVRPFASTGARIVMIPTVARDNPGYLPSISQGSKLASDFRFGLDLLLSEQFAINVQAGYTSFAQLVTKLTSEQQAGIPFGGYAYYSQIAMTPSAWTMLGASYTVNPSDPFRIILNANAGVAWLNSVAPMGELGLTTELDLSSRITVRPAFTFDVARVGYGSDQSGTAPLTNGFIYHNEITNSQSIWESSVGVNIGIMFRY
jgi:hypothetical protein